MRIDRRGFLAFVGASAAGVSARPARAQSGRAPRADDDAMLFDATKCIGCKNCVHACADANGLPRESTSGLWHDPTDLNAETKNIIQQFRGDDGRQSFVKRQCMHCIEPACTAACMIQALHKDENGVVVYEADRCIGCRYCQVACPFEVPKFQWGSNAAVIVKCEMCAHRVADGREPACCEVCPTHAVIYGPRDQLLADAHARIAAAPERYEPSVYGEHEAGGTQVMYLSKKGVSFQELGLPKLGPEAVPALSKKIQHTVYKGFIAPIAVYVGLVAAVFHARRKAPEAGGDA